MGLSTVRAEKRLQSITQASGLGLVHECMCDLGKTCRRVHDHCCGVTRVDSLVVCPASAATPWHVQKGRVKEGDVLASAA